MKNIKLVALLYLTASYSNFSFASTTTSCSATQFDEISQVRYVHDGDTLHLTDGRKVRLIGINTPELARDNKPAEPFASESKDALKSLLKKDKSISLVFGNDRKDRYGRYLAHAFLTDGTNVQARLLQRGLARTITIPPNTRFSACYQRSEHSARCNEKGLWADTAILKARLLKKHNKGFQLVRGTVNNIKDNKKGMWLTLDNKLTIGIRSEDLHLFDHRAIKNMLNQTIIVRGWINNSKRSTPYYLRIRHPLSIHPLSTFSC